MGKGWGRQREAPDAGSLGHALEMERGPAWPDCVGIRLLRLSGESVRGFEPQDEERHQGAMQGFGAGKVPGATLAEWEEQIVVGGQEGGSQNSLGERQQDMSQERTEGPERSE